MTNNYPFFPQITADICDLFRKYGVDPEQHMTLVVDLMRFVYDEKIEVAKSMKQQLLREQTGQIT